MGCSYPLPLRDKFGSGYKEFLKRIILRENKNKKMEFLNSAPILNAVPFAAPLLFYGAL